MFKECKVDILWDSDARVWVATSDDAPHKYKKLKTPADKASDVSNNEKFKEIVSIYHIDI